MKKLTIVLIVVSLLFCSLALVGCKDGDDGETFVGAISKTTYESKEDAAKGFLEEEISGDAFTAEYVSYTKTSELSKKEIKELAIADVDRDGIESVEKGEVEYVEQSTKNGEEITERASETRKRTVYIIIYETDRETGKIYKFYVPACVEGETLSSSYYDYIFDKNRYLNCTVKYVNPFNGDVILCKFTENIVKANILIEQIPVEHSYAKFDMYYYSKNNRTYFYVESKETDEKGAIEIGSALIKDLIFRYFEKEEGEMLDLAPELTGYIELPFYMILLCDHSYFVKTNAGYGIQANGMQVLEFYDFGNTKIDIPKDIDVAIENAIINKNL